MRSSTMDATWIRSLGMGVALAVVSVACSGTPPPTTVGSTPATVPATTSPSSLPPPPRVRATRITTLRQPVAMTYRAGDPALYLLSKAGRIWALRDGAVDPTPVLDLTGRVSRGNEQGLLGMAFSPDGAFLYVDYTDLAGDTNIVEYAWVDGRADESTRRRVLFVDQPYPNHNGGNLVFGPDGFLYIGMGDGGSSETSGPDHFRNGQNLGVLLGKMLRIDPRPSGDRPYGIPPDNPFVGVKGARPEIWAYGLRHPWRYSFDRATGDLWIGDVGGGTFEEIDVQPAGSPGGQNYGWLNLEGTNPLLPSAPPGAVPPSYEYSHRGGGCAIVGGYVYRGTAIPGLDGWYLYGDYCLGVINALRFVPGGQRVYVISGTGVQGLSSFGQDQQGELYAMSIRGEVYRFEP